MTYTQAFPSNPIKLNGYFLDYTVNSQSGDVSFPSNPVIPGVGLGNFFFTGSMDSTFLVAGPADGTTSFSPGDVVTYSGTATDTSEPGALSVVLALWGITALRRRVR